MGVVVDMVDTIAEIALAFGAVAELQIGAFRIGSAADRAFVTVGALTGAAAVMLCPVRIRLRLGHLCARLFPPARGTPQRGKQILYIPPKEQQIV